MARPTNNRGRSRSSDKNKGPADRSRNSPNRGRNDKGPSRRRDLYDEPEKRMHRVKCDKCHSYCEVPFRPTENKPVYCSNCFRKEEPKNKESSKDLEEINKKLDLIMKALKIHE